MLGLILCGGTSSRMGTDKALLKLENKTWAQLAADKLGSLHIAIKMSVSDAQLKSYTQLFPNAGLIADDPSLPVHGPLLGLLSCHLQYAAEDLFILACDMPLMSNDILTELYLEYSADPGYDVYICSNDNQPEPLCGIYNAHALARLLTMLKSGQLTRYSMKFALEQLRVNMRPATDQQKIGFRNFNDQSALGKL
ncbi:MAG: molybdenum cofactor guanylyltransferase [Chitinophagaceae bacterium]|nr:MAG: molybdenum cofactor guanylyltransferase [Chitinophagaceae bacterium]